MRAFKLFTKNKSGGTSVEYALLASIIAMSIVVAFANYAGIIGDLFSSIANSYEAAAR